MTTDLAELFYYDETSPSCLRWKVNTWSGKTYKRQNSKVGEVAGHVTGKGYWRTCYQGRSLMIHHVVYKLHYGTVPRGMLVDHWDRDRSNNRVDNLRLVNHTGNQRNRKPNYRSIGETGVKFRIDTNSGFTLVCATVRQLDGKQTAKVFSTNKYGLLPAYKLAVMARRAAITELNKQGAGYTQHHGKTNVLEVMDKLGVKHE